MTDELNPPAFYFWIVTDERTGNPRKTSYRMQPETAAERFPGATLILSSKEVRGAIGSASEIGGRKPGN